MMFNKFKRIWISKRALPGLDTSLAGDTPQEEPDGEFAQLLATAQQLQHLRADLEARPGLLAANRQRVMSKIRAVPGMRPELRRQDWAWRLALQVVLIIVVFLSGAGLALASESALPGDSLYPLRGIVENMRLALILDPGRDAALRLEFAQDYLVDSAVLLSQDRHTDARRALQAYDRYMVGAGRVLSTLSEIEQIQLAALLADLNQTLGQDVVIMDRLPLY